VRRTRIRGELEPVEAPIALQLGLHQLADLGQHKDPTSYVL